MAQERKTIKEWELESGIKVKDTKGFWGKRNEKYTNKYTKEQFRRACRRTNITIKTQKGLDFINKNQEGKYERI